MSYRRTVEDALEVIGHAKHMSDDVLPVTQAFYYPSCEETNNVMKSMRLLDVDEEFLRKLEEGERFVFKGSDDERVVLCSEVETYEVKEAEISNALVFVPRLQFLNDVKGQKPADHVVADKQISGILNSYLELRPTFPRLSKLRKLLQSAAYNGPDKDDTNQGYYLYELLELVQSSRAEILDGLREISACCIDGRWRLLSTEYETRVLSLLINLAEENAWIVLPKNTCVENLKQTVPKEILCHIFDNFTIPTSDNCDLREWNEKKVCRSFGEMLLRAGDSNFRFNEFMMAWKQCLPQGVEPDLSSLRGLALIEQEGTPQKAIHLFPEFELPENVSERFRLLFKRKKKWTMQEIEPYIEKLVTKGMNASTMLTKFSRASTLKGVKVFGARHVK